MKVFIVIGAAILASVGFLGPVIDIIMLNHLAKDKQTDSGSDHQKQVQTHKHQIQQMQFFVMVSPQILARPIAVSKPKVSKQAFKMGVINNNNKPNTNLIVNGYNGSHHLLSDQDSQFIINDIPEIMNNNSDVIKIIGLDGVEDQQISIDRSSDGMIEIDTGMIVDGFELVDNQIQYSVEVQKSERDDETGIFRNPNSKDALLEVINKGDKVIDTLQNYLVYSMDQNKYRTAISFKKQSKNADYQQMSYDEVFEQGLKVARAIKDRGLQQISGEQVDENDAMEKQIRQQGLVGFFGKNEMEGMVGDIGCQLDGIATVWFYDTLGQDGMQYILDQTKLTTVFSSKDGLKSILKMDKLSINNIVYQDISQKVDQQLIDDLQQKGYNMISYQELLASIDSDRNSLIIDMQKVNRSSVATISYTSGTTGDPKGVVLLHSNIVSALASLPYQYYNPVKTDRHISYLPLAHVLEKLQFYGVLTAGGNVGVYSGDATRIQKDIEEFQPTLLGGVPRVYNMFKQKIASQFAKKNRFVRAIIKVAMKIGYLLQKYRRNKFSNRVTKIIFKTVRDKFGGNIRVMCVGSAPVSYDTVRFMQAVLGVGMVEGYGQTECMGAGFATDLKDNSLGHVGGPFANIEFKIRSAPSLNYHVHSVNPQGELMLRGPSIFHSYYKNPNATYNAIDQDGWLHTGDIVTLNDNGSITIIDRIKSIFKLSQGEYVAPERVEKILRDVPEINEVFIYGDSLKNHCVGIVHLNPDYKVDSGTLASIISKFGKKNKLSAMEIPKKIHIINKPFSQYPGCLTDSFKFKRQTIYKTFKKEIEILYQ